MFLRETIIYLHLSLLSVRWLVQDHAVHNFINSKSGYNLNQSAVEKLVPIVKLISPHRKPINQHFW